MVIVLLNFHHLVNYCTLQRQTLWIYWINEHLWSVCLLLGHFTLLFHLPFSTVIPLHCVKLICGVWCPRIRKVGQSTWQPSQSNANWLKISCVVDELYNLTMLNKTTFITALPPVTPSSAFSHITTVHYSNVCLAFHGEFEFDSTWQLKGFGNTVVVFWGARGSW